MPLLRIDLYEGRTDAELKALLDAIHGTMLAAFNVPVRYQNECEQISIVVFYGLS